MTAVDDATWRFQQVVNSSRDAFVEFDGTCHVTEWSHRAESLLGWSREDAIGRPIFDAMTREYGEIVAQGMEVLRAIAESSTEDGGPRMTDPLFLEVELLRRDGTPLRTTATVFATGAAGAFRAGSFLHAAGADVSVNDAITRERLHDPLTGLASRLLFTRRLSVALGSLRRRPGSLAVVVIGLDRFNTINDALGHDLGDEVLVTVAARLRVAGGKARPLLARLGGDQFLALFDRPGKTAAGEADAGEAAGGDAEAFATRALEGVEQPIVVGGREIFLTASVGISDTADPEVKAGTLLSDADAAMYAAKGGRGGTTQRFGQSMRQQVVERLSTEHSLHRALDRRELALYYQPVVDVARASAVGVEALIRWNHPQHGLVAPDRFISVAEESGLIIPIGAWVLEEACNQLRAWGPARDQPGGWMPRRADVPVLPGPGTVEVNLSARQIDHPELVRTVERILSSTGLPPERLTLEITESALMRDAVSALEVLRALKSIGVDLAIDDFGTGYSSLSYLQRFPLDILKVDKSFVDDLDGDQGVEIVAAVVNLAHALGLDVVAEGVETEEQFDALSELGCDYAQGYLFSRPVPAAQLQGAFALEVAGTVGAIEQPA
ncbi:MAG: putative bifunctional diguanylate cyclase/phosphodiesterase [Acidimicrobiales bacterium]